MKRSLSFGAVAIVLLLVAAGISYWAVRETSQSAPAVQSPPAAESSPSVGQGNPTMGSPAPQSGAPAAPAAPAAPPSSATAPNQPTGPTASNEPSNPISPPQPSQAPGQSAAPPTAPSNPEPPAQPSQATSPAPPPSPAVAASMPSEHKVANRRQVQEALHRLGYYDGPVDGIFGPLTRAAIRRFQESIGEKSTGHLTAVEASRLVSTS